MTRRFGKLFLGAALLFAGSVLAAPPASAVIGGSVSTYGPWAAQVLLDGRPFCSASVIAPEWILGASHCFFDGAEPIEDSRFEFRVGNLDQRKGTPVHPIPGGRVGSAVADLMLVKVPPMQVPAARLTGPTPVKAGQLVRQYGWGITCDSGGPCDTDVLKQSDLRIVDPADPRCEGRTVPGGPDFCAEGVFGIPAGGDSGGPLMTTDPEGQEKIVGVLTTSNDDDIASAVDVSGQLNWIRSVAGVPA